MSNVNKSNKTNNKQKHLQQNMRKISNVIFTRKYKF